MNSETARRKLIKICEENGFTGIENQVKNITKDDIKISVAFLGEFGSGKSQLINAIIGKRILPTFAEPTTAVITKIVGGEKNQFYKILKKDKEKKIEIQPVELAEEVTNSNDNYRIDIQLENLPVLSKNVEIIDTPGIDSINDMHSDITYGYLPKVDIAFLCIDIAHGGLKKSFIDFLDKLPEILLDKLYFLITKSDLKTEKKANNIKGEITKQLSQIVNKPKIIVSSAKNYLNKIKNADKSNKKTGIQEIKKILTKDIFREKENIQERRFKEQLIEYCNQAESLLHDIQKSLSWDYSEIKQKINKNKEKINDIKNDLKKFKQKIRKIKTDTKRNINNTIEQNAPIISQKLSRKQDFTEDIQNMIKGVDSHLKQGFSNLVKEDFSSIDRNIQTIIKQSLKAETHSIINYADTGSKAATFALLWFLIPGTSAKLELGEAIGAIIGTIFSGKGTEKENNLVEDNEFKDDFEEENNGENKSKEEKSIKNRKKWAKIVQKFDIVDKFKQFLLPKLMKNRVEKSLKSTINTKIDNVFTEIENTIDKTIKNKYQTKLEDYNRSLNKLRNERDKKTKDTDKKAIRIDENLKEIKKIKN